MLGCAGCEWQQAAGRGGFGVMQGWLEEQAANSCRQIPEPCTSEQCHGAAKQNACALSCARGGRLLHPSPTGAAAAGGVLRRTASNSRRVCCGRWARACRLLCCWFPPRTRMRARGRAPRRLAWWRPRCWRCWWATTRAGPWGGGVRRACLASIPPAACWAAAQRRLMCAGPGRPAPRGCLAGR